MAVGYVCWSCGHEAVDSTTDDLDQVLCEVCGEPVVERAPER